MERVRIREDPLGFLSLHNEWQLDCTSEIVLGKDIFFEIYAYSTKTMLKLIEKRKPE